MTEVDDVIASTFNTAESDEKCKATADGLRSLYATGKWEPAEIMKAIAASRKSDEADQS
jgi:hypothetical protein